MKTGFEHLGIDELRRLFSEADRIGDKKLMDAVDKELSTRDIDCYEAQQAEARFGA